MHLGYDFRAPSGAKFGLLLVAHVAIFGFMCLGK